MGYEPEPRQRRRRVRRRALMFVRLALLAALLLATYVFHASGHTLELLRVARIALIILLVIGAGVMNRRGYSR